jgi:hypothetical protein
MRNGQMGDARDAGVCAVRDEETGLRHVRSARVVR